VTYASMQLAYGELPIRRDGGDVVCGRMVPPVSHLVVLKGQGAALTCARKALQSLPPRKAGCNGTQPQNDTAHDTQVAGNPNTCPHQAFPVQTDTTNLTRFNSAFIAIHAYFPGAPKPNPKKQGRSKYCVHYVGYPQIAMLTVHHYHQVHHLSSPEFQECKQVACNEMDEGKDHEWKYILHMLLMPTVCNSTWLLRCEHGLSTDNNSLRLL
jgi:hypothetical protein